MRFDVVVVDADPAVRVADRDVEGEVVVESVVGGVVEAREGRVGNVEFEHVGAHDEPEEKAEYCYDDEDCGEDLADEAQDAVEDAAAEAAQAAAAAAVAAAAGGAVVGFRRRNGGAVVRAV